MDHRLLRVSSVNLYGSAFPARAVCTCGWESMARDSLADLRVLFDVHTDEQGAPRSKGPW